MSYDLSKLGQENFERLAQALVQKLISPSAKIYGRGRDGGRDAVFIGKATYDRQYPTSLDPWDGHWIFQAKFHNTNLRGHDDARSELLSEIEPELDTVVNKNNLQCDNYIIITNVSLTSVPESGTRDKLEKLFEELKPKYNVKNMGIWSASEIDGFLINFPEIKKSFEVLRSPMDIASDLFQFSDRNGLEVSYLTIDVNQSTRSDVLQTVRNALNVRNEIEGEQIPFVSTQYLNNALEKNILFLYGRSGIGKSRTIYELLTKSLDQHTTVYIINPYSTMNKRSMRENLSTLVTKFRNTDIIIWDNFPNDMVQRNYESARSALEIITSKNLKSIISLNPLYPESYAAIANSIPEINIHKIFYDKIDIKELIYTYGTRINQFHDIYNKYVQNNIDRICEILWMKEPIPMIVLEYYKQLSNKISNIGNSSQSIDLAQSLTKSKEFYINQFKFLKNDRESSNGIHFLYTLKLCYQLGIRRDLSQLLDIQASIFGTSPPVEPTQVLDNWIYLSSQYYSLHDLPMESIIMSADIILKIMQYLRVNPSIVTESDNSLYLAGLFIGQNIKYLFSPSLQSILPPSFSVLTQQGDSIRSRTIEQIARFNKNNIRIEDSEFKKSLVEDANNQKDHFGLGLGIGLAQSFPKWDNSFKFDIWNKLVKFFENYYETGYGFGLEVGSAFKVMPGSSRSDLWRRFTNLCKIDGNFSCGFGESIGRVIESFNPEDIQEIQPLLSKNVEFPVLLSMSIFERIRSLETKNFQNQLVDMLNSNERFKLLFAKNLKMVVEHLAPAIQSLVLKELKDHNLLTLLSVNTIRCDICNNITLSELYFNHKKQHDILIEKTPLVKHKYEKCPYCNQLLKSDPNEALLHIGEQHYDLLDSDVRIAYDEWKAVGYPSLNFE